PHSAQLVDAYHRRASRLHEKYDCYLGRSRIATLTSARDGREGCVYCGRCLWGCPASALYTPSITLRECLTYPNFNYRPRYFVSHFTHNAQHQIEKIIINDDGQEDEFDVAGDRVVLAAGTLSSAKILLESVRRSTGEMVKLHGLMDNRQVLVPFVNPRMLGEQCTTESYQYHQLAIGIAGERKEEYIHGQITTLKSAVIHPIIANVPLSLRASIFAFRNVRAGLGVVNLNLCDRRREGNYVGLERDSVRGGTKLSIQYAPADNEPAVIDRAVKTVKSVLGDLGCFVPPGMVHVRPMGASVHYTGTLPMSAERKPYTTSKYGQSHDFENLYFVDGTTFPFLPAKNVTFTLMANAMRIADQAF
ncbi:MAG: GMC oxidoreductase, partial [Chloroflexota bacterium]